MTESEAFTVVAIAAFGFCMVIMLVFILTMFRDNFLQVFSENAEDIKFKYGVPSVSFNVYVSKIGGLATRGFWGKFDIYQDFLVLNMWNKALVVNDFDKISLSSTWMSLSIGEGKYKTVIALSNQEYKIVQEWIKNFKEKNNV